MPTPSSQRIPDGHLVARIQRRLDIRVVRGLRALHRPAPHAARADGVACASRAKTTFSTKHKQKKISSSAVFFF
jgi:hypothetical protein